MSVPVRPERRERDDQTEIMMNDEKVHGNTVHFFVFEFIFAFFGRKAKVHRTVKASSNEMNVCRSQRDKAQTRCVEIEQNGLQTEKEPGKDFSYTAFNVCIGVFSDDFAAVDVREELRCRGRPEKANSEMFVCFLERKIQEIFLI